jgi:hypothetical protein
MTTRTNARVAGFAFLFYIAVLSTLGLQWLAGGEATGTPGDSGMVNALGGLLMKIGRVFRCGSST